MRALLHFMVQFKNSTEAFAANINSAARLLRKQLVQPQELGLIDTLSTSLMNFVQGMDDLGDSLRRTA